MRFNLELWKEQSSNAIPFPYKKKGRKHSKEIREYTIQGYRKRWENVNVDTSLAVRIANYVNQGDRLRRLEIWENVLSALKAGVISGEIRRTSTGSLELNF